MSILSTPCSLHQAFEPTRRRNQDEHLLFNNALTPRYILFTILYTLPPHPYSHNPASPRHQKTPSHLLRLSHPALHPLQIQINSPSAPSTLLCAFRRRRPDNLCILRLGICDLGVLAVEDDFGLFEVAAGVWGSVRWSFSYGGGGRVIAGDGEDGKGDVPSSMRTRLR